MQAKPGQRRDRVLLQNPITDVPDGDGGFIQAWADLDPPRINVSITSPSAAQLQRAKAGTVLSQSTRIILAPYHAGITTDTRILFGARQINVTGIRDIDERHIELEIIGEEVIA